MKKLFYFLFACLLFACSDDSTQADFDIEAFPQKWVLVRMTGNIPNSTVTGANMDWQEYYQLNEDKTFVKVRTRNGITTEATGTYTSMSSATNEKFLILTYTSDSDLIGSCYSASKEESLILQSTTTMSSTWLQCDGPGLDYERVH